MQLLRADQLVGRTLGDYQVEQLLGQGQLNAVYTARQKLQGRTVMITTFHFPEGSAIQTREQISTRFAREGAALVRLRHPNILPTYDFGEQAGYLYLVTPFGKGTSLLKLLKQQARYTPKQTFDVLKQIAAALDYAHSNGVVHGALSLSSVLMSNELSVQIAGFGMKMLFEVQGDTQVKQPQGHLFSAAGTFLGSPEYISPERVLGLPTDARSDIYALGIMLFELLSGKQPFSGANPLETALKRIQRPVPSIQTYYTAVPEALDLVISKALEHNPAERYQRAGELAAAFERILNVLEAAAAPASRNSRSEQESQNTLFPTNKWQFKPPITTGRVPRVTSSAAAKQATPVVSPATGDSPSLAGFDPFVWWAANSGKGKTADAPEPVRPARAASRSGRQPVQQDRRRLVKLIATGTAAAAVLAVSGISFAHFVESMQHSQSPLANVPTSGTTTTKGNTPTSVPTKETLTTPTAKPSPTKGATPTAKPTQPPTPTPPSHTGTVIGFTNMPGNTAKSFNNPADGLGSLLIHLPNGNFTACEKACTHEGVPVYYDGGQQKLVCPAHGAIFDPFNGFSHVSGPGNGPLPKVSIRVNADGTITAV